MAHSAQDDGFHEIQLNGKQLVFLFMAATVVSVVIFLCGVLVGRGVRAERGVVAMADVPPADQMIMQMKYALTGVGAGVDDDLEAAFGDPLIAGETRGHLKNLADDRTIVRFDIKNAGEMFARTGTTARVRYTGVNTGNAWSLAQGRYIVHYLVPNGTPNTVDQTYANIAGGQLKFTPAPNTNGIPSGLATPPSDETSEP